MSLWVLVTASFVMIHLIPGDPVRAALGVTAPQELVAARRAELGLNDPLWLQYWHYLHNLAAGNWGTSIATDVPVTPIITDRLPATLEIAGYTFVVAVAVSVPAGVVMAALTRGGRGRRAELAFTSTSVLIAAVPEFLLAVGLVYVFGVSLGWLPVAGRGGPASYVIPVLGLAAGPTAVLARIVRVEMLTVLVVRTARAKRFPAWSPAPYWWRTCWPGRRLPGLRPRPGHVRRPHHRRPPHQ